MTNPINLKIAGTGSALPRRVMPNSEFEQFLDTSDEWIKTRTGVEQRHIVEDGETTAGLGVRAGRAALDDARIDPADVDLTICATITPECPFPATACFIQDELGLGHTPAFDLSAACSGFVYGVVMAAGMIHAGIYRTILVIGSESMTRFTDFQDRGSCILFGDGAGAAVLTATDNPHQQLLHSRLHADGSNADLIWVPAGGARMPASVETVNNRMHYMKMKGREVFKFAVVKMLRVIEQTLTEAKLTADQISLIIPHQSNLRIIESMRTRLGLPTERVYVNIDQYGNTSAASIPIALDEARKSEVIGPGDLVLMVAVGAGMTWATALVRL
jgi:3-oxoacyl-[acyl-carrier-protein] synthase-3